MTATRQRRSGVTLLEVMVATGIMAVGLVCIMALFPIGAVNMARAITQDRSATHGVNSDMVFRFYWKQAWNDPNGGTSRATNADAYTYSQEPMLVALEYHPNPNYGLNGTIVTGLSQPSYPVLVDPVGFMTNSGLSQLFVAPTQGLPANQQIMPLRVPLRRCINYPAGNPGYSTFPGDPGFPAPPYAYPSIINAVVRNTALLDDMTFARPGDNSSATVRMGEPADFSGQIERAGRYNTAWLIQRGRNDAPSETNVSVLVYAGRSATDTPSPELVYPATAVVGTKSILVALGAQALPPLKRGGWVAFHRIIQPPPVPQGGTPAFLPYMTFDFYRVSGLNSDGVATSGILVLELETPIKQVNKDQPGLGISGKAVVFDNLVEVFDRGTVSAAGVTGR